MCGHLLLCSLAWCARMLPVAAVMCMRVRRSVPRGPTGGAGTAGRHQVVLLLTCASVRSMYLWSYSVDLYGCSSVIIECITF